jgi:hypothetical protein
MSQATQHGPTAAHRKRAACPVSRPRHPPDRRACWTGGQRAFIYGVPI